MKKMISVILAVVMVSSTFLFSASAVTKEESKAAVEAAYNAMFDGVAGDINNDGRLTAADARCALLCSAGLLTENINTVKADVDGDGKVTAIDARILLRVSAALEPQSALYSDTIMLQLFNALINDVKPSELKFRKNGITTNKDITYDNKKAVDDFTKQMNSIPGMAEEDKMDFGKELTSGKGQVTYNNSTAMRAASDKNFPVLGEEYASALTVKDISGIEYKTNQSFSYQQLSAYSSGKPLASIAPVNRTGLDTLTIYLNAEKVTDTSKNKPIHSKCFDIATEDDVKNGYAGINGMIDSDMKELVELIPGAEFDINVSFNYLNYHDSFITIYFEHDTKQIVAIESNLTYDYSVAIYMDISVPLMINFRKKTINVVNTDNAANIYCFVEN